MPLISISDELKKAQREGYAVPLFDTFELMGTRGILAALEEKRAPGIIGLGSGLLDRPDAEAVVAMVRSMAEGATVPVSLMLDHGAGFEDCVKALRLGFSDVMYDGSKLALKENVANTRMVVRAAHAVEAAAEAEIGHVGRGDDYQAFGARGEGFTDPEAVEEFVAETDVDLLAVAIGTAHGLYEGEPKLALDLLSEIRERVEVPLVLHGGSGLSDDQFQAVIERGIAKINIFTNLAVSAGETMVGAAQAEDASYFSIIRAVPGAFQRECGRLLDVFGASGKA